MSQVARGGNPSPDSDWLNKVVESAIEPELEIIDSHHHLWNLPYRYLLEEYASDIASGHNVVATVYVEGSVMLYNPRLPKSSRPIGEVEFASGMGAMAVTRLFGPAYVNAAIVGHADLTLGEEVLPILNEMRNRSPQRFKGIRYCTANDDAVRAQAPAKTMLSHMFRRGFAVVQEQGLTFDAWLYHPQLPELIDLMEEFPRARVALNHVGGRIGVGPYQADGDRVDREITANLKKLSRFPNFHVKLGGLGMTMAGYNFHTRETPPTSDEVANSWVHRVNEVIDLFGAERCMFESNFPVDKVSFSYSVLWNAFKKITLSRDGNARRNLFSETARRFYSIA